MIKFYRRIFHHTRPLAKPLKPENHCILAVDGLIKTAK